jgi:hypothetical protein
MNNCRLSAAAQNRISPSVEDSRMVTYSPPLTLLVPKLLPTTPVHLQVFPAELTQVAVAVAPTWRQVTDRRNSGEGDARVHNGIMTRTRIDFENIVNIYKIGAFLQNRISDLTRVCSSGNIMDYPIPHSYRYFHMEAPCLLFQL